MYKDKNDPYLRQIPCLSEEVNYVVEEDLVNLVFKNEKKIQNVFRKLGFKIPRETKIELDPYASFVFLNIDGNKSIYEIGQGAKVEFPDDQEMLYERLLTFTTFLNEKNWIKYK